MKYRKKPVVIEAVEFNGSSSHAYQIKQWMAGKADCPADKGVHTCDYRSLEIETLEGVMTAQPGDWIIRGIAGEFYPCKREIFTATYEPCL